MVSWYVRSGTSCDSFNDIHDFHRRTAAEILEHWYMSGGQRASPADTGELLELRGSGL